MERDRSAVWFTIAGVSLALAGLALTQSGNVRETNPGAADQWVLVAWGLAGAGVAFVIVGLVTHFRRPRIKFRTAIDDKGDEAQLSLFRSDGGPIDGARCRITKWRRTVRPDRKPIGSVRVTFAYPGDLRVDSHRWRAGQGSPRRRLGGAGAEQANRLDGAEGRRTSPVPYHRRSGGLRPRVTGARDLACRKRGHVLGRDASVADAPRRPDPN